MLFEKDNMLSKITLEPNEKLKIKLNKEEIFLKVKDDKLYIDQVPFKKIVTFIIATRYNCLENEWDKKSLEEYIDRQKSIYKN